MPGRKTSSRVRSPEVTAAEAKRSKRLAGYSLTELADMMQAHVPAAIETLGKEAAEGNTQAAKTILEFLTTVAREGSAESGNEVLDRIAEIRNGKAN